MNGISETVGTFWLVLTAGVGHVAVIVPAFKWWRGKWKSL